MSLSNIIKQNTNRVDVYAKDLIVSGQIIKNGNVVESPFFYSTDTSLFLIPTPTPSSILPPVAPTATDTVQANGFYDGNSFKVELNGVCTFANNDDNSIFLALENNNVITNIAEIRYISTPITNKAWKFSASFIINEVDVVNNEIFASSFLEFGYQPDATPFGSFAVSTIGTTFPLNLSLPTKILIRATSTGLSPSISTRFANIARLF